MEPLRLDVWADVACPWCWIGHATLRTALLDEEPDSVRVVPRAFELQPQLPPAGLPAQEAYAATFGSPDRTRAVLQQVASIGAEAGLAFRFDLVRRAPNTRMAHRLVAIAGREGLALDALEALFSAVFREGLDVADPDVAATAVARATGLEADALRAALAAGEGLEQVLADEEQAADLGAQGVPFFVAGHVVAVTGAQDAPTLGRLLAAARERRGAA